jgi:uncharacterized membrane protein required for colicin V production
MRAQKVIMISIHIVFWLMVIFFAIIGYIRGWQKEVIAATGLIASIAALHQFGYPVITLLSPVVGTIAQRRPDGLLNPFAVQQHQFWVQAIFHTVLAFFSFQMVARLADMPAAGGRLGPRIRGALEKRVIGAAIGAVNGYLLVGTLWGFLEYALSPIGYVRLPPGQPYPFDPNVIVRPSMASSAMVVAEWLPLGILSPGLWLLIFFIAFFIVIVALI